jgi:glutamine amidotransferase
MIAIIDYGMGNLRSVQKAFERVGARAVITSDKNLIAKSEKVVLPGVGAMQPAMNKLKELDLVATIKDAIAGGRPFLGICLGLQLLFDKGYEGGEVQGLGVVRGSVTHFPPDRPKVPHMGWNQINIQPRARAMYQGVEENSNVYFCHSFQVNPKNEDAQTVATSTDYYGDFVSSICKDNIWAVQFHPEKSQKVGLQILKNFAELP